MINNPVSLDDITHWSPPGTCGRLRMLRLDKIHPIISGNKWFKLRPNLDAARDAGLDKLLSFGGGYSNHLVALAFAAKEQGFSSVGIVRGQYDVLTPSLQSCIDFGMTLRFVSGAEYSILKDGEPPQLARQYPGHWIIPEGGANLNGVLGASAIVRFIPIETTDVIVSVGTGTTLAGLDSGLSSTIAIHGYCAAKDMQQAIDLIDRSGSRSRTILHEVQDPRFGRWKPELLSFMRDFLNRTGIRLDVVYTGKMMQQLQAHLQNGAFTGRDITCIHTGGLQGNPDGLFPGN